MDSLIKMAVLAAALAALLLAALAYVAPAKRATFSERWAPAEGLPNAIAMPSDRQYRTDAPHCIVLVCKVI